MTSPQQATGALASASLEMEQALLGSILQNNANYDQVSDILRSGHFAEALHGRIYQTIGGFIRMGRTASPLTIKAAMADDPGIKDLNPEYVVDLVTFAPTAFSQDAANWAKEIRNFALRRGIVRLATEAISAAGYTEAETTPEKIIEQFEGELHGLIADGKVEPVENVAVWADRAIEKAERAYQNPTAVGCTTGLRALDEKLGLLVPGDLVVVGGSTSMGKTAIAQQIAWHTAKDLNRRTLACSLEMTGDEYTARHIAQIAGVPATKIEAGWANEDEMQRVVEARQAFNDVPLFIDGTPRLTVNQIRSRVRRAKKRGGLALVLIDHLRFIEPNDPRANERDQLQQITRDLKTLAKECEVCVLLVSHVNREANKRTDRKPMLSDLYGASAIEQNADTVFFVYREEYWLQKEKPEFGTDEMAEWDTAMRRCQGKAKLMVQKRRRGPTGDADVGFDAPLTRFFDLGAQQSEQKGLL